MRALNSFPRLSALRRDENGASAVEFALVGSAFIALCIGLLEFGSALQVRNELAHAADRGARLLIIDPEATDEAIEAQVEALLARYDSDMLAVDVTSDALAEYRTISIAYDVQITVPFFPVSVLTLSALRQVPIPAVPS